MSHFSREYKEQYTQKPKPGQPAPTTRPDYIPETTRVGGRTYDVTYDVSQGGYGYWMGGGPGAGRWVMYDPMADTAMTTMLMNRNSYYYGPSPSRWSMRWWRTPAIVLTLVGLVAFLVFRGAGSDYPIA